jgi:hypothetical protein
MAAGCASIARSGGVLPSMRLRSTTSCCEAMLSCTTSMPVAASKSATAASKSAPSPPIHCVWIVTRLPLNGLSEPSAWSSAS